MSLAGDIGQEGGRRKCEKTLGFFLKKVMGSEVAVREETSGLSDNQ